MASYGEKALELALREVGTKEQPAGSNDGPRIRQYQASTRAYKEPWCASFVYWCLLGAGYKGGLGPNPAYVPSILAWAKQQGIITHNPEPGDLAIYDWQRDGVADHIGIVRSRPAAGSFTAVEGNTSVGNDSNGGEVMIRSRSAADVAAFVHVPGETDPLLVDVLVDGKTVNSRQKPTNPALLRRIGRFIRTAKTVIVRRSGKETG